MLCSRPTNFGVALRAYQNQLIGLQAVPREEFGRVLLPDALKHQGGSRLVKRLLNGVTESDRRVELGGENPGCLVPDRCRHSDRCIYVFGDVFSLITRVARVEHD